MQPGRVIEELQRLWEKEKQEKQAEEAKMQQSINQSMMSMEQSEDATIQNDTLAGPAKHRSVAQVVPEVTQDAEEEKKEEPQVKP